MRLKVKKEMVDRDVAVLYLIHTDGTIITIQNRAWMDTMRLCMFFDLREGRIR